MPKYCSYSSISTTHFIFEEVEPGTYTIVMEFSEWEGGQNLESKALSEWLQTEYSYYILRDQEIKSGQTYEFRYNEMEYHDNFSTS